MMFGSAVIKCIFAEMALLGWRTYKVSVKPFAFGGSSSDGVRMRNRWADQT